MLTYRNDAVYTSKFIRIMQILNRLYYPDKNMYTNFVQKIQDIYITDNLKKANMINYDIRNLLLNKYSSGNTNIAKKYLKRADGQLFYDNHIPLDYDGEENICKEEILNLLDHYRNFTQSSINK